jgi:DNA-directed RNA polymerase subunit M/transcription elongation factor TFIIS
MTTVIRGRARAQQPPTPAPAMSQGETGTLLAWAQKRALYNLRRKMFAYELAQGLITEQETVAYNKFDVTVIEDTVRHTLAEVELAKELHGDRFQVALQEAIRTDNLTLDIDAWDNAFQEKLDDFQNYEVVFFRNRTTAFTLTKSCPNCGQKKLVAEGQVFTRSADEAATQFATCKNCSSRFRLHSVL